MRNVISKIPLSTATISILLAFVLTFFTATTSQCSIFSYTHDPEKTPVSTEENVAANTNEIEENSVSQPDTIGADTTEKTNLYTEIPGVGAVFSHMLDSLIKLTRNSENRFQALSHHVPLVFPDLYKVLITL